MPDPYWLEPASDRHVNPNAPVGTDEIVALCEGSVLDYGCGTGQMAEFMRITGCDINRQRIRIAKHRWPSMDFFSIRSHKDVNPHFDTVLCNNVLLHVPDDEIVSLLEKLGSVTDRIVIAEHLGRGPRRKVRHYYPLGSTTRRTTRQWNRDLRDYQVLFGDINYLLIEHIEVMNPRYGREMSIMLWRKE
jgi:SAM-dependent methyltransferase